MGDNNHGNANDDPIPFAAPLSEKEGNVLKPANRNGSIIPIAIAAFVGALAGAVVGSQIG